MGLGDLPSERGAAEVAAAAAFTAATAKEAKVVPGRELCLPLSSTVALRWRVLTNPRLRSERSDQVCRNSGPIKGQIIGFKILYQAGNT